MTALAKLESEVLNLPEDQRVALVHRVLGASDISGRGDIDALWESEIQTRIDRLKQGQSNRYSASDVFQELSHRF